MLRFHQKIHFLLGYGPQFIQQSVKIDHIPGPGHDFQQPRRPAQNGDILFHDPVDPPALHLDHHRLAAGKPRCVNLRHRRRPQRRAIDPSEHVLRRAAILRGKDLLHRFKGHGHHTRAQFLQLVAIRLREHV